jgi:hypothetical protein
MEVGGDEESSFARYCNSGGGREVRGVFVLAC